MKLRKDEAIECLQLFGLETQESADEVKRRLITFVNDNCDNPSIMQTLHDLKARYGKAISPAPPLSQPNELIQIYTGARRKEPPKATSTQSQNKPEEAALPIGTDEHRQPSQKTVDELKRQFLTLLNETSYDPSIIKMLQELTSSHASSRKA